MSKTYIHNGLVTLYTYIDTETKSRAYVCAKLPDYMAGQWENDAINMINWKIDADAKTVLITYQIRLDPWAPILDATLPVVVNRVPLKPPTKSRNWELIDCDYWRNKRTGERCPAF